MIVTGIWFIILISLGLASVYSVIKMIMVHHFVQSLAIIVVVFVIAVGLEAALLLVLRSRVAGYKKFWSVESHASSKEIVYVALGDSAAQGIGASSPNSSYVKILAGNMGSQTGKAVRIINISQSGAKLKDVIDSQLPKLQKLKPDIVTIDIGSNDIAGGTPQDNMIQQYELVISALSSYNVVFANLPDFMWGTQQRNTLAINEIVAQLCGQYGLKLADLHQITHQKMWSLNEFAADGFHPSNNGHRTWANAFLPGIKRIF